MRVPALNDMLLQEFKVAVILVDVVFIDSIWQSADNEEVAGPVADPACSVEDFLCFMPSKLC